MSLNTTESTSVAVTFAVSGGPPSDQHRKVGEFTQRLFNGAVSLAAELDPETNEELVAVSVAASGSVQELVAKNDQWHREIVGIAGSEHPFRLIIDPQ
jgi:hypothetical protein